MCNEDKESFVNRIFTSVASRYDIMNDLMSFGIHRLWKRKMVGSITANSGKLLDVASGTGDIALKVASKGRVEVTLCDINYDMLKIAREKAVNLNTLNFSWLCASAEYLPVLSNTFDYYTIAFGIRNVSDRKKALDEAYRVLKFGGKFICLEFSPLEDKKSGVFQDLYNFYSFNVIPKIGKIVANDKKAYEYLVKSIRLFPKPCDFKTEIENSGFLLVDCINMSCGIVTLYTGWKV